MKTYFYSSPQEGCKTNIFIIKNDKILKYREFGGFSYVNYINKNGHVIDGWVRNKNIIPDNEKYNGLDYIDFSLMLGKEKTRLLGKTTKDMDNWINNNKISVSDPDNHGFYKGFESWNIDFSGVYITISQTNKVMEKRLGYNDTYVSGITLVDRQYKTIRGISVGDSWNKVISKYGRNSKADTENKCNYFQYFDMRLTFCLDTFNNVQSILFEDYPIGP
ncbi:hypothetical protein [Rouxiella sp. Mn2063]|uniref:hypothetical protein n=1 Tax=Rouxiella sp. Mn2063 TaxID=3395262 RepID=UPI003BDE69FF